MKVLRMIVLALVTLSLLVACGPAPTPTPTAAPTAPPPTATPSGPQRGGTLTIASGHQAMTLDHHLERGWFDMLAIGWMCEGLVQHRPDGSFAPALAESWDQEDDLTWVFHLRKGVKFHDGTDFDAHAVAFNWERLFAEETNAPRARYLNWIESWEAVDDYTLRVRMKYPYAPWLALMTTRSEAWLASPAAIEKWGREEYGVHPTCTGPFKFKEYVANDRLVLEAYDEYWGGRPYLDQIVLKYVLEDSTRTVQMQTGQALVTYQVEPGSMGALTGDPDVEVVQTGDNTLGIEFNVDPEQGFPFTDRRVREALYRAIDRDAIAENILPGLAVPIKGQFHPDSWGANPNVQEYPYDPEKAKELLAEAGYPDGFETKLAHPTGRFPSDAKVAEAVQGYWAAVGVKVELESGDIATWVSNMRSGTFPTWMHSSWGYGIDPDLAAYPRWHSGNWGGAGNYLHFKDARVDELLEMAQATLDQDERQKYYQEMDQILTDYIPRVPLYGMIESWAYNRKLKNFQPGPVNWLAPIMLKEVYIEE